MRQRQIGVERKGLLKRLFRTGEVVGVDLHKFSDEALSSSQAGPRRRILRIQVHAAQVQVSRQPHGCPVAGGGGRSGKLIGAQVVFVCHCVGRHVMLEGHALASRQWKR